jgi:hypothetical protein
MEIVWSSDNWLQSKDVNLCEKSGRRRMAREESEVDPKIDENQAPNAPRQKGGEDLPPHLFGCFPPAPLGLKANIMPGFLRRTLKNANFCLTASLV